MNNIFLFYYRKIRCLFCTLNGLFTHAWFLIASIGHLENISSLSCVAFPNVDTFCQQWKRPITSQYHYENSFDLMEPWKGLGESEETVDHT